MRIGLEHEAKEARHVHAEGTMDDLLWVREIMGQRWPLVPHHEQCHIGAALLAVDMLQAIECLDSMELLQCMEACGVDYATKLREKDTYDLNRALFLKVIMGVVERYPEYMLQVISKLEECEDANPYLLGRMRQLMGRDPKKCWLARGVSRSSTLASPDYGERLRGPWARKRLLDGVRAKFEQTDDYKPFINRAPRPRCGRLPARRDSPGPGGQALGGAAYLGPLLIEDGSTYLLLTAT